MKWLITRPGRQVVLDDERAEDRLADDAERQQRPEQRQVPAERAAEEGEDAAAITAMPTKPVKQPVAVLDHRVDVERRHRPAVALGPVRAAEARSRSAAPPAPVRTISDSAAEGDQRHLGVELRA